MPERAGAIVVDTGREPPDIDACLRRLRVEKIAAVFITHQHADHDGGIAGAGRNRQVGQLFYSVLDDPAKPPEVNGLKGDQLASGDHGNAGTVSWRVLAPSRTDAKLDENDASLVIRFEMQVPGSNRVVSMLATGDMQETPMGTLLASGAVQRADILKIAHHGAANGGTEIIDVVRPAVALISVGKDEHVRASEPGHHRGPAATGACRRCAPTSTARSSLAGKTAGSAFRRWKHCNRHRSSWRQPVRKSLMRALRIVFMGFSIHYVRVRSWLRHEAQLRAPGFPGGTSPRRRSSCCKAPRSYLPPVPLRRSGQPCGPARKSNSRALKPTRMNAANCCWLPALHSSAKPNSSRSASWPT